MTLTTAMVAQPASWKASARVRASLESRSWLVTKRVSRGCKPVSMATCEGEVTLVDAWRLDLQDSGRADVVCAVGVGGDQEHRAGFVGGAPDGDVGQTADAGPFCIALVLEARGDLVPHVPCQGDGRSVPARGTGAVLELDEVRGDHLRRAGFPGGVDGEGDPHVRLAAARPEVRGDTHGETQAVRCMLHGETTLERPIACQTHAAARLDPQLDQARGATGLRELAG